MKTLYNRICAIAVLATLTLLTALPAHAGYNHEMLNPESVAAVDPVTALPDRCRLLADDLDHQRPIYFDCDTVYGLGAALDNTVIGAVTPLAGHFTTLSTTGTFTGGSSSNIAINSTKFTVTASSGNTAVGGTLGVTGTTTAAAINASGLTTTTGGLVSVVTNDLSPTFSTGITANPVVMTTKGSCSVATVNAGTCIPLAAVTARTITVTHFDIVAAGSAATCTGIFLEDTNGTPVVIATLAAATLTSGAHNVPLAATLGVGFGAGSGLTAAKGVQIIKNGSDCATTTSFAYTFNYTIQ